MKKAIYIFLCWILLCGFAHAFNPFNPCDYVNLATQCHKSCGSACPRGSSVVFNSISPDLGKTPKVCKKGINPDLLFNKSRIGWGRNCAIPAGEHYPSQYSCISTGNIFGEIIDTITTVSYTHLTLPTTSRV